MAVSRILSGEPFGPPGRSFILPRFPRETGHPLRRADATSTRRLSACADGQAIRPPVLSCTAGGLSCAGDCSPGRWALTPPFHPCPVGERFRPERMGLPRIIRPVPDSPSRRSVLCDTFRRRRVSPPAPPLSQGLPPFGVRTFLSGLLAETQATVRHHRRRYASRPVLQQAGQISTT